METKWSSCLSVVQPDTIEHRKARSRNTNRVRLVQIATFNATPAKAMGGDVRVGGPADGALSLMNA